jgi:hypothetical protein
MLQLFGYVSGVLILIEFIPYIRDIFRHKTKPQRTTWLIFSVLGSIAFFSQLAEGATKSLWLPGAITFTVTCIFLLSLKYGVGGFARKDYIVLTFAALGLLGWYLTDKAVIALYIVIAIDIAATMLTIEKAYRQPESETLISWALSSTAGVFAMLAVGKLDVVLLSYPLMIAMVDGAVVGAILLGRRRKKLQNS